MAEGQLFGVLRCGGIDIAVNGADLIEVVSLSGDLTAAALAPPYVLGLHDLRGSPVPVIDLPVLLGRREKPEPAPIAAVIEHGGYRLAIAAEELGALLQVEPGDVHPIEQNQGGSPAVLKAVLYQPGGGMVQVLDLASLLTCDSLTLTRSRGRAAKTATQPRAVYLIFTCAGRRFALPASAVQELLEDRPIEHSPFAGGGCLGMIRSRGRAVPVIDAARLLGLPLGDRPDRGELVVMLTAEGPVALKVSRREDILSWREADIAPTAAMGEVCPGLVRGIARTNGAEVLVLDPEALAATEVRALARGHRELFGKLDGMAADGPHATAAEAAEVPRAYVIFEAGLTWLVAMEQVVEIIDSPDPAELRGAASARQGGVLIHRSRSVSFIDLCGLVGAPRGPEPHGIIVKAEGQFFGFQVTRVVATAKAAVRRAPMGILSTNRGEEATLVRRHASFVYWKSGEGMRSAVLLDLRTLALDAYGSEAREEHPVEAEAMA